MALAEAGTLYEGSSLLAACPEVAGRQRGHVPPNPSPPHPPPHHILQLSQPL